MTDEGKERSLFKRILLALDPTTGPASLEAAAELASRLKAELIALFVEDTEVIEAADHPHSRHVNFPTGDFERVSGNTLARQFRSIAESIEARLEQATARFGVTVSFHIVRGTVQDEVESHAAEADLIFVDRGSHSFTHHALVGGKAGGLIERSSRPLLIWRSPTGHHGPVMAVVGWGDEPERLLEAATRLAGDPARDLIVAIDDDEEAHRIELREACHRWLVQAGRTAMFLRLDRAGAAEPGARGGASDLERAVRSLGTELVIVSGDRSRRSRILSEWLEITERPVFLVR